MPSARINGVTLDYEETGSGFPLIWCHEFGGDYRSWEPQVRYFSRRYRVITWNYRGYPPSDVPQDPAAYRNEILVEGPAALMRHLGIERAHVGGLPMGGNVALNFGIAHPDMPENLIICGCGSGTVGRETFPAEGEQRAQQFLNEGIEAKARNFAGLVMLPMTGHTSNIEEPALFNLHVAEFLAAVEHGRGGTWKAEKASRG